jgi:hypothetical protein
MVVGIAHIAPGPFLQLGSGARSFKKTGDRRIVATALAAPMMAAPGGMRLALVHLVGLRNYLFAFLDVAEKTGDGNMISRIAGQLHHNLEVTGKLLARIMHEA